MHFDVKKLLEVQKIDQRIARLKQTADSVPRERSKREARLGGLQQTVTAASDAKTQGQLRCRELDLSIRQSDDEIKNLKGKLGLIKNNAEYQAILFQIEAVETERNDSEDQMLGELSRADPVSEALDKALAEHAEENKVHVEFCAEADKLTVTHQAEIDAVSEGRGGLIEGLAPELIEKYERLFESRDGLAVCEAEDRYCQGCYTQFTVNDLARLQGGRVLVECSSCFRILYLVE